jgi:hypothetical protein
MPPSRSRSKTLRALFGASIAATCAVRRRGAAVAMLMPISLVVQQRHRRLQGVHLQTRASTRKPAHEPHGGCALSSRTSPSEAGADRAAGFARRDPWGKWKRAKVATFKRRLPLYLLFAAGFGRLLFAGAAHDRTVGRVRDGIDDDRVGIELTCYYYSFLFATTFLYSKRKEAGAILLGVTAATGFIDWAPTKYLPTTGPLANFHMSQWLDEQYMFMSIATLLGFVWIMYEFAIKPMDADEVEAPATARAAAAKSSSSGNRGNRGGAGGRNNKRRRR